MLPEDRPVDDSVTLLFGGFVWLQWCAYTQNYLNFDGSISVARTSRATHTKNMNDDYTTKNVRRYNNTKTILHRVWSGIASRRSILYELWKRVGCCFNPLWKIMWSRRAELRVLRTLRRIAGQGQSERRISYRTHLKMTPLVLWLKTLEQGVWASQVTSIPRLESLLLRTFHRTSCRV